MLKKILTTLILLFAVCTLSAQSYSACYTSNMNKGNAAYSKGRYSEAKTYYTTAKKCEGGNPAEAQKKIYACDAKIKAAAASAATPAQKVPKTQTITVNGVSFKMIAVQGGTFTMGCTSEQGSDCDSDESPSHRVTLSGYCIGETEVTQALWKAVMGGNPSHFKGDNLPVEQVSWDDVQVFIRKLNALTGKTFRLPTEAEWEYAARGGSWSLGYKYSGGSTLGDVAWYDGNSGNKTHPVGTKAPNELGLYDMSGNVWEWCSDWYGSSYYGSSPSSNPRGLSSGSHRVLRGGSWYNYSGGCRVSNRSYNIPDCRRSYHGFRLVLVP